MFQATAKRVLDENLLEATSIANLETPAHEKLRLLIELQMTSYAANFPYVYVYIQEDMGKVAYQTTPWARDMVRKTRRFESIVTEVITKGVRDGEFREDLSPQVVVKALFGMVNWTHRWFKPGVRGHRADQVIETFSALLYDGLKRR
ncbi:hypothetical protein [Saccharopolyspora pogona]|uniref:hypothetical protein n=1 Tax=Saccharopolyspora pogona TaxID=333966 RepID=UPI0021E0EB31|nr:hypothetical protein [Saccharopolyspora pogona]